MINDRADEVIYIYIYIYINYSKIDIKEVGINESCCRVSLRLCSFIVLEIS